MAKNKTKQKTPAAVFGEKKPGKIAQAESHILSVSSRLGYKRLHLWMLAFLRPGEALKSIPEKPDPKEVAWNLLIFYLLFYVMFAITTAMVVAPAQGNSSGQIPAGLNFADPQVLFRLLLVAPCINTLAMLFTLWLLYLCARLVSGKAGYWRFAYAVSCTFCGWMAALSILFAAATTMASLALLFPAYTLLGALVGALVGFAILLLALAGLAVFLWGVYSAFRMIKAVHSLSSFRSALSMAGTVALVLMLNEVLIFASRQMGRY